jgi:hypothetical protein
MERPLFNSRAYLKDGAVPKDDLLAAGGETTSDEPLIREDIQEEAVEEEPRVLTEPAGGGLFD